MASACPIFKTLVLCVAAYIITVIRMLTAQITLELKQIENYFQPVLQGSDRCSTPHNAIQNYNYMQMLCN